MRTHRRPAGYDRPATYPAILVADKTVVTAGQLTDVEQWLFDRMPQSRHPDELARHLLHHDGRQMTAEDVIMLYRIAYWKSKPWEEIDNACLTKFVKEDMDQIWDRVTTKVRIYCGERTRRFTNVYQMQLAGRPQWAPSELKARYFSTSPVVKNHTMLS